MTLQPTDSIFNSIEKFPSLKIDFSSSYKVGTKFFNSDNPNIFSFYLELLECNVDIVTIRSYGSRFFPNGLNLKVPNDEQVLTATINYIYHKVKNLVENPLPNQIQIIKSGRNYTIDLQESGYYLASPQFSCSVSIEILTLDELEEFDSQLIFDEILQELVLA